MTGKLKSGIDVGHYALTELGAWTLANRPERFDDISDADALCVGYIDFTESGKHAHDKHMAKLIKQCGHKRHGLEGFFYPRQYCDRTLLVNEMQHHLDEADKVRRFLADA